MKYQNLTIIETSRQLVLAQVDFQHTRGETMVYAIVDRRDCVEGAEIDEKNSRWYITMRVASLALGEMTRPSPVMVEIVGPAAGKSFEQMLAFLER